MFEVKELNIFLNTNKGKRQVVKDVNFNIPGGKIYTIIGKNGEGKSTILNAFTKLLSTASFEIKGEVILQGNSLFKINEDQLNKIRKEKIKYVFQDAASAFDPLRKIGYYFNEVYNINSDPAELLDYFLLPEKTKLYKMYPHELSGGMAQRVLIVLGLLAKPDLLLLDEPTSAIDIPIANLLCSSLKEFVNQDTQRAVLIITQDLTFAEKVSDKIAVLSNGQLSEFTNASEFKFKEGIL